MEAIENFSSLCKYAEIAVVLQKLFYKFSCLDFNSLFIWILFLQCLIWYVTNVSKIVMKGNIFKTNFIYAEIICWLEWALGRLPSGAPLPSLIGPGRNDRCGVAVLLWSKMGSKIWTTQSRREREREKLYYAAACSCRSHVLQSHACACEFRANCLFFFLKKSLSEVYYFYRKWTKSLWKKFPI